MSRINCKKFLSFPITKDLTNAFSVFKILVWIFFIILSFILQSNHFFDIEGVNPNLILLIIFLAVILEKKISEVFVLILIIIILSLFFWPYWLKEILILSFLGLAASSFKKFLTGNDFYDFLILIFLATLAFYLLINFHYFFGNFIVIVSELIYNTILGFLTIFGIKNFFYVKKTRIRY